MKTSIFANKESLKVEVISVTDMDDDFGLIEEAVIRSCSQFWTEDSISLKSLLKNPRAVVTLDEYEAFIYNRELDYLLVDESSEDLATGKLSPEDYQSLASLLIPQVKSFSPVTRVVPSSDVHAVLPKSRRIKGCDEGTVVLVRTLTALDEPMM